MIKLGDLGNSVAGKPRIQKDMGNDEGDSVLDASLSNFDATQSNFDVAQSQYDDSSSMRSSSLYD